MRSRPRRRASRCVHLVPPALCTIKDSPTDAVSLAPSPSPSPFALPTSSPSRPSPSPPARPPALPRPSPTLAASPPPPLSQRKPRGPRQPRADDETEEAGDAPSSTNAVSDAADALAAPRADGDAPARKPRNRTRKGAAAAGGALVDGAEGAPPALGETKPGAASAAPRQPRRRGPPAGAPSSTLIFVGNLNFSVTNESLAAAFAPECTVKSAVVVVRKFGQSAGRSKGFAFVDFASQQDQERALERFQGKELEGRPMSLKVAIQPEEGAEPGQGQGEAQQAEKAADTVAGDVKVDEQSGRTEGDAIIVAS